MYTLHATKKLRDRVKRPLAATAPESSTWLGDWYGTVLFWRQQLALLVNEQTLFPVLMPLAPAASLVDRFPAALGDTLETAGVEDRFIDAELAEMVDCRWAKTANRSVLGVLNEFAFLAAQARRQRGVDDPIQLALRLAQTPCGPLYKRQISPDRELAAAVASWLAERAN